MPKINFMIHSHCYILGAPFTEVCYPCGAIEEVDEICKTLKKAHGLLDLSYYTINLIGHGSIVFASFNIRWYEIFYRDKLFVNVSLAYKYIFTFPERRHSFTTTSNLYGLPYDVTKYGSLN